MNLEEDYVEVNDVKTIQRLLCILLKKFHDICEENNLNYVIFGGTLLGAVRHKGFIPWDDDIDVAMPREDYDRFIDYVKSQDLNDFLVRCFPDDNYVYPFAKFCLKNTLLFEDLDERFSKTYLYIDVFPIDGYPDSDSEKSHFRRLSKYKKYRCDCVGELKISEKWWKSPIYIIRFIKKYILNLFGYKFFIKKTIEEQKKYSYNDSTFVSMQGSGWNEKGKLSKKILENRVLYSFDNLFVYGIKEYDQHLKKLYGDYMTLPPLEMQVSNHNYSLYVKKNKFTGI